MSGTNKLSKFIVEWENGTRLHACNNCANRAVNEHFNFAQLYLRTDKVKINEQKTSIEAMRWKL